MATDILLTDLTDGTLDGNGVFDKLMIAVNTHIEDQHSKGRLDGTDYAEVYLGSMQTVIAQSMQFIMNEKMQEANIDMALAKIITEEKQQGLVDQQLIKMQKEVDLMEMQEIEIAAGTARENALNTAKISQVTAATDDQVYVTANMRPAEVEKVVKENVLTDHRSSELLKKIALLGIQEAYMNAENPKKLDLLDEQIASAGFKASMDESQYLQFEDSRPKMLQKLDSEVAALNVSISKVMGEIAIIKSQHTTMEERRPKDFALLDEQIAKVTAETAMVTEQKTQLTTSVGDNRIIRAMSAQADMLNGITMAQLTPTAEMFYEFYKLNNSLTGGTFTSTNSMNVSAVI